MTYDALSALTIEEVNTAAYELGAHVLEYANDASAKRRPSAFIACAPANAGITEEKLLSFLDVALAAEVVEPDLSDLKVPTS